MQRPEGRPSATRNSARTNAAPAKDESLGLDWHDRDAKVDHSQRLVNAKAPRAPRLKSAADAVAGVVHLLVG